MKTETAVTEVLAQAAAGRCVLLSRSELRGSEGVAPEELRQVIVEMSRHKDECLGKASREIFGESGAEGLGHATAWIDAGDIFEKFIKGIDQHGPPDTVFCLDPWTAQLRSRAGELASSAKWILVADGRERGAGKEKEYWTQLDEWFKSLSFAEVISRSDLNEDVSRSPSTPVFLPGPRLFAQKPGAWQWHQLSSRSSAISLLLIVRYSGSLSHLRVLLDSVARQEGPREGIRCVVLRGSEGEDPGPYLKWFEQAHPRLGPTVLQLSTDWKEQLELLLANAGEAVVVLVGDHSILPLGFARQVRETPPASVQGVPIGLEASAHILTGNLDPHPNYETLLQSLSSGDKRQTDCARILAPRQWAQGAGDAVGRLFEAAKREQTSSGEAPWMWLELEDLP